MDRPTLEKIAAYVRYRILTMTHRIGSGHPTTSFSAVDLATVLFFKYLRFDTDNPGNEANDRVIFSKGHASALFYALYHVAGKISEAELATYREKGSVLEGHPTSRFPFTEAATGSLGQGLSIAAGISWAMKAKIAVSRGHVRKENQSGNQGNQAGSIRRDSEIPFLLPRVYVVLGDGELAEGSVWEAIAWASHNKLSHLIAIVDVNRFGQAGETMHAHNLTVYRNRFESFGWGAIVVDGHDFGQIDAAYEKALVYKGGPVVILARTVKGKGITEWEDQDGWHNKMLPDEVYKKVVSSLSKNGEPVRAEIKKPEMLIVSGMQDASGSHDNPEHHDQVAEYDKTKQIATKQAFGNALLRLARLDRRIVVLDGDVANSLHTDLIRKNLPDRFLEMYIAEQNMAGVALGLSRSGFLPVVATFSAFLTRAHDQFRMMPLSGGTVIVNGSYAGVSVGRDGPSQMGLEDISMFRSIHGSTVLYPSDAYSSERLLEEAVKRTGVIYIRTIREPTPVVYKPESAFTVGGSKVWRLKGKPKTSGDTCATIVCAGITLHEALKAQVMLSGEHIPVNVVDCYSVKPIDALTLRKLVGETGHLVVAEDHFPEGGLGEAVLSAISGVNLSSYVHLAVRDMPFSAGADELLAVSKIDAQAIAGAVRSMCIGQ
jgi:transketolase